MILIGTGIKFAREISVTEENIETEKAIMESDAGEELSFQTMTDAEYFSA